MTLSVEGDTAVVTEFRSIQYYTWITNGNLHVVVCQNKINDKKQKVQMYNTRSVEGFAFFSR